MEKVEATMSTNVRLFITVLTLMLSLLHIWVLSILTQNFTYSSTYNWTLTVLCILGVIAIPVGYSVSHQVPRSRFFWLSWAGYIWMGIFFMGLWISTLYFVLTSFFPNLPIRPDHILVAIILVCLWSLFQGLKHPVVRVQDVSVKGLKNSFKLVQITDLHMGLLNHDHEWLKRIVNKINQLEPDFVALTGDLVEGKWAEVEHMLGPVSEIKARLGKLYVTGNHEFIHGGMMWERKMAEFGWTVLHNSHQIFSIQNSQVMIAGVPDRMVKRFEDSLRSVPEKALKSSESVDCKILLAHEPASVWDLETEIPDVILSGHTHGGQIFPFHFLVRMVQPVVNGWKKLRGTQVFAHPGTGLWGPPMRLGSENQIVLMNFKGEST